MKIMDSSEKRRYPYVIAEIGINHNGDIDLAKRTIQAAADVGADAVKFQSFDVDEFMADHERIYEYESVGTVIRESMYDMFKRLQLPAAWHEKLFDYASLKGLNFLSSTADQASVDLLESLGARALKISSEDIINLPLLQHVAQQKTTVILSTGMADQAEIDAAVSIIQSGMVEELILLHCVSLYPTPDDEANLARMISLRERYGVDVGYSDHTLGCEAAVAATAMGAKVLEKHFTLDKNLKGPDHVISADPEEFAELVRRVRRVSRQLGDPGLKPSRSEEISRREFRRSIVAAVDIPAHAVITRDMLSLKRPGNGMHPNEIYNVVGHRTRHRIRRNSQVREGDLI